MYQPIMSEKNVRRLYFLKQEKKKPMTKLLDNILNEYFEQHNDQNQRSEGSKEPRRNAKHSGTHQNSSGPGQEGITAASDAERR